MNVDLVEMTCYCGVPFAIPKTLQKHALKTGESFYCPKGCICQYTTAARSKWRRNNKKESAEVVNFKLINGGKETETE